MSNMYRYAQEKYAAFQVDVEQAVEKLKNVPVSIHCWQGDDVTGLESSGKALSGGIQVTGNYPGKARNFEELKADFLKAMSHVPGKKRISLHACYAVFEDGKKVDRDQLLPEHFAPWVEFAKENDLGIDFKPIVEIVSTYKMIKKQAGIFELGIGKGGMIVCTMNVLADDPAAQVLYSNMVKYLSSDEFAPDVSVSIAKMQEIMEMNINIEVDFRTDECYDTGGHIEV